ncbi:hypothetical protein M0R45_035668 [Rubus argutus]|uniref:Uncharacterized protein n=1 Tax=Rubus argutus TaxID=59490 RepID=A0AAW1VWN8_RUBAR
MCSGEDVKVGLGIDGGLMGVTPSWADERRGRPARVCRQRQVKHGSAVASNSWVMGSEELQADLWCVFNVDDDGCGWISFVN